MKYLNEIKIIVLIYLSFILIGYGQNIQNSNLINFSGVWRFVPPENGYDSTFLLINNGKMISITYWLETKKASIYGSPYSIIGFWNTLNGNTPKHISELKNEGSQMLFYDNIGLSYDSTGKLIKPTRKAFASFNGIGTANYADELFHEKGDVDFLAFYFKSYKPDIYVRINKLPEYVLIALRKEPKFFRNYIHFQNTYLKTINLDKSKITSISGIETKMYLIKGDEVEVLEEKGEWLKIRYYGKKIVEGWIKKSDVE